MEVNVYIYKNADELGREAAKHASQIINAAIAERGTARIVMSTGNSQKETIQQLLKSDVDWSKVEVFHLDEYIGLPQDHPASFRKYLQDQFLNFVQVKNYYFVNVEGDIQQNIAALTKEIRKQPIDLGFIGIGENAHIAFNDPPADFETKEAFIIVNLDERCKRQQVGEGWFPHIDAVPKQAVTMTVHQIMQCRTIISCVPDKRKAEAVKNTVEGELSNLVPATMLKQHNDFHLYLDQASASELDQK
jgi:glucosamine-6-phosphate deaminase